MGKKVLVRKVAVQPAVIRNDTGINEEVSYQWIFERFMGRENEVAGEVPAFVVFFEAEVVLDETED
jgi:hypothetical protein